MSNSTYRVTAPYVTLRVNDELSGGQKLIGFYTGAILPPGTDGEDLARHIRKGMVEKVTGAEAAAVDEQRAEADEAAKAEADQRDKDAAAAAKEAEKLVKDAEAEKKKADDDAAAAAKADPKAPTAANKPAK